MPGDVNRPVGRVLLVGMLLSILLTLVGIGLLVLHPQLSSAKVLPIGRAVSETWKMRSPGWLSLGIFVLILTPLVTLITAVGSFARIRDWRYAVYAAVALVAMGAGLLLGKA